MNGGMEEPKWEGPHPPANARSQNPEYWAARQAATGINSHGDTLEAREVLFVERMNSAGQLITDWIPKQQSIPAADFYWNGKGYELKSPDLASGIENAIRRDRAKASKHPTNAIEKFYYMADVGTQELPASEYAYLTYYNNINVNHPIKELWIMGNGQLTEIPLQ